MRFGGPALFGLALLHAACGFSISGGVAVDADVVRDDDVDAPGDSATDGPPLDMAGPCPGRKRWKADFSTDPREVDFENDGTVDWALRNQNDVMALPGTLSGGTWAVGAGESPPLDTRPLDPWNGITTAKIRMRATSDTPGYDPTVNSNVFGSVFWINAGYDNDNYGAVIVSVTRKTDVQTVQLFTKTDIANRRAEGASIVRSNGNMIDIDLTVDMVTHIARMEVGGDVRSGNITEFAQLGNADRFATLYAWQNDAEFDSIELTNCP